MRTTIATLLLGVTALALGATAQPALPEINPQAREILDEKVRKLGFAPPDAKHGRAALKGAVISESERRVGSDDAAESEIHAAINPLDSNNIVVSPIRYERGSGALSCPIYYTKDFGQTWHRSTFSNRLRDPTHTLAGGGDPVFAFDADGNAYFTWIALYTNAQRDSVYWGMFWAHSTDGGATWTREENDIIAYTHAAPDGVPFPLSLYFLPAMYDKQWMAVDRTTSPYRNTIYTALVSLSPLGGGAKMILVRKPAGGAPASEPVDISDDSFRMVQFASIDVDRAGSVHVSFFGSKDGSNYGLWHSRSDDGGESFSTPNLVSDIHIHRFSPDATSDTITGVGQSRLYPCPHIAVDKGNGPNAGTLYAVWTADGTTSRLGHGLDIYFARSTDNGDNWSEPIVVNDDERGLRRNQFHPSITVSQSGIVTVTWYDRRAATNDRATTYQMAHSFDGGRTFSANRQVTDVATDFTTVGGLNGGFGIGEYTQVLSTDHFAIPFWADGRGGDGDLDIYTATIPITEGAAAVEAVRTLNPGMSLRAGADMARGTIDVVVALAHPSEVRLRLLDARGALVRELGAERIEAGEKHSSHDIGDLASGQYFVRIETESGVVTRAVRIVR